MAGLLIAAGCAPRATVLGGTPAPARLPSTELPNVYRKVVFVWKFRDGSYNARGDGVARVAPPDSVRLDFFVNNEPTGYAILIGDSIQIPSRSRVSSDALPPPPLLWAALGRLRVPAVADSDARVDGDTLWVDIGRDPRWRATYLGGDLRELQLIKGGRVPQVVERQPSGDARYTHASAHRTLDITVLRVDTLPGFDAEIWR